MKYMKICYSGLLYLMLASLSSCATGNRTAGETLGEVPSDMVTIPAGWFVMGYNARELNEMPEYDVLVNTFLMDKYEVSAGDFAVFLNEQGNPENRYFSADRYSTIVALPNPDNSGVGTKDKPFIYAPKAGFENYPANNISWYGAEAYCRWNGKRLPTEAEWEKAARGNDKRMYPWGNSRPDDSKARYGQKWTEKGLNVMVPVDALPEGASSYGVFNMAGNVWEWVSDWYRQNYCDYCNPVNENIDILSRLTDIDTKPAVTEDEKNPQIPPKNNPQGPLLGNFKVLRGGSWYDSYGEVVTRSTYRYRFIPDEMYLNTGFRCAR